MQAAHAADAQGPDRLRQEPVRRTHGLATRTSPLDHPGLQRGYDRRRIWSAAACSTPKVPRWQDGPLTLAARHGAICYLDEVVEARADTTVVIHPLTDARRMLPIEKLNQVVHAHPDFHLVISYNPGYQSVIKDLKTSTKQRFAAIEFGFPAPAIETEIVAHESGLGAEAAAQLVALGERTRRLKGHGLDEGASTRMLVHAGALMAQGVDAVTACRMAIVHPVTDDTDMTQALEAAVAASF